jgi:hypothetical protein
MGIDLGDQCVLNTSDLQQTGSNLQDAFGRSAVEKGHDRVQRHLTTARCHANSGRGAELMVYRMEQDEQELTNEMNGVV